MSLARYKITFNNIPSKERSRILRELDVLSDFVEDMIPPGCDETYFLLDINYDVESVMKSIHLPTGCVVKKMP